MSTSSTPALINLSPMQESAYSEEDEDEDEEDSDDDESVIHNGLEDALMEVSVQLPRLAVTVPPSVLPPKVTKS